MTRVTDVSGTSTGTVLQHNLNHSTMMNGDYHAHGHASSSSINGNLSINNTTINSSVLHSDMNDSVRREAISAAEEEEQQMRPRRVRVNEPVKQTIVVPKVDNKLGQCLMV